MSKETTTPIPLVSEVDAAATQDRLTPVSGKWHLQKLPDRRYRQWLRMT